VKVAVTGSSGLIGTALVASLRADGHEVLYIAELDPGVNDETVLLRSRQSGAMLQTADKDFGELVFRQRLLHAGVLLIRLSGLTPEGKAELIAGIFDVHGGEWATEFAVLSKRAFRLRRPTQ